MLLAIVLTLNEERHLPDCLQSLAWVDAVLVFDSFSTDGTLSVAQAHGATVLQHHFENYAAQRNAALAAARQYQPKVDWVLFIDADERVTDGLAAEIRQVTDARTASLAVAGWWVPRHNYLFGRLTRHAGWYPDYQLRLLRPQCANYNATRGVHELVELEGTAKHLQQALVHINYERVAEFVSKQYHYARLDAQALATQGKRVKPQNFVLQPMRQFWWRYITLQGWRMGWHGLLLSVLLAYFQWVQYRDLWQITQHPAPPAGERYDRHSRNTQADG